MINPAKTRDFPVSCIPISPRPSTFGDLNSKSIEASSFPPRRSGYGALLFANDFHQDPFASPSIEFAVENLLPWPEVELSFGNGYHHLPPHDLPFQMRIGIVFAGAIVLVLRGWFMR